MTRKKFKYLAIILIVITGLSFSETVKLFHWQDNLITIYPKEDTTSLLRNPSDGLGIFTMLPRKIKPVIIFWDWRLLTQRIKPGIPIGD